jgi:transcriptional regulator with XRE-family HTH domain
MTGGASEEWKRECAFEVVNRCLRAMRRRGMPGTAADIGRRLGLNDSTVRKILAGERPLRPEFLRDLGLLAGLPVAGLFQAMDWLPEDERPDPAGAGLTGQIGAALQVIGRALPSMERLGRPGPWAPVAAAQMVLGDEEGAERFDVRLSQIASGTRYRAVTGGVAEFALKPGAVALPYARVEELAEAAGVPWRPSPRYLDGHPEHSAVALELRARTHDLRRDGQEYSWQGGPGHRTWRSAARTWPAHLLVQDPIGGRQLVPAGDTALGDDPRPIVVIGGRHGTGLAAALIAEALGRRFVLVRGDIDVNRHGHVLSSDGFRDRMNAWMSVAQHITRSSEQGPDWPVVALVRPAAFADGGGRGVHSYAGRLLRTTPARIVYARTPPAYLTWWGSRIEGDHQPGEYDGAAWAACARDLYAGIESVLAGRPAGRDLLVRVPDPAGPLPYDVPGVPDEVMDWTARVAWTAIEWLGERDRGLRDRLRPGRLRTWRDRLAADPTAVVPRLDDLG